MHACYILNNSSTLCVLTDIDYLIVLPHRAGTFYAVFNTGTSRNFLTVFHTALATDL
jgi:hypothetical protein